MNKELKVKGYPFVNHVDQNISPEIKINLVSIYESKHHLFLNNLQNSGYIKCMGYLYNIKPYLNKYVVKQYNSWQEYFAPNKTLLRKSIYGKIDKIVQVN